MSQPTIAIVGSGQAGLRVAAWLRELYYQYRVLLIGDERHAPYQRPPLSKGYLLGEVDEAQVTLRPSAFFSKHHIELISGKRAVAIDRPRHTLSLDDDSVVEYDHLILATGARNRPLRVPGAEELGNVFYLRTLDEAVLLRARMALAKRVVVIGAGFIGLEFATSAAKQGLDVTVLDVAGRAMARAVSRTMSSIFAREHEKNGVRLLFNAQVARLLGEVGRVSGVETVDGRILTADLVVIGIGVIPNVELAARCDLAIEDGVVVDEYLQTRDPCISAIGDVAAHVNDFARRPRVRLESVQNACDQARCVALRLIGQATAYRALPWFWSDQGDLRLQMAGLPDGHDEEVVRGDPSGTACSVFLFCQGKLVCVETLNRAAEQMLARQLLANRVAVTPRQAADPDFDLRTLLPSPASS
jgi:3-phenylpropionate/trans-cinnamate dioxygenase ferredoxin reductase component